MALKTVKHKFTSTVADVTAPQFVHPTQWNDEHDLWLGTRGVTGTTDTLTGADHLTTIKYNISGPCAVSVAASDPINIPAGWATRLRNYGSGLLTLTPTGGATVNGQPSITVAQGETLEISCDGSLDYDGLLNFSPMSAVMTQATYAQIRLSGASAKSPLTASQFQVTCDELILRDTNGRTARQTGLNVTCDVSLAGPVANGRDQAAAFTNAWAHFYWIYNFATNTLATIASLTALPGGPVLPSGYTFWAYIGSIRVGASNNLTAIVQRDSWIFNANGVWDWQVLANGQSATEVQVDCSAYLPPATVTREARFYAQSATNATGVANPGPAQCAVRTRTGPGTPGAPNSNYMSFQSCSQWEQMSNSDTFTTPILTSTALWYQWISWPSGATNTPLYLWVMAYRVANGAD